MDQHKLFAQTCNSGRRTGFRSDVTELLRLYFVFLSLMTATSARAETGRAFASPEACRGSGFFSASDCASAFVHAADLVRERAPHFADRIECVLSFKLCDRQDGSYLPSMLGVEMRNGPGGTVALPMLAVVTPRGLFRDPAQNPAAQDARDGRPRDGRSGGAVYRDAGRHAQTAKNPVSVRRSSGGREHSRPERAADARQIPPGDRGLALAAPGGADRGRGCARPREAERQMTSALDAGGSTAKIGSGFASLSGALRAFLDWERREAEKLLPRALRSWALGRGARAAVIAGGGAELGGRGRSGLAGFPHFRRRNPCGFARRRPGAPQICAQRAGSRAGTAGQIVSDAPLRPAGGGAVASRRGGDGGNRAQDPVPA